jgi:uncharacterized alpha-E superfamily protein
MLSRVADNLYWMSRYLERAEHTARVVDVNLNLSLDQANQAANAVRWERLTRALHVAASEGSLANDYAITQRLTFDPKNVNSVVSCIGTARENARQVREKISSEMWLQVNTLYLDVKQTGIERIWKDQPSLFFMSVKNGVHLFQGITASTMARDEGWHFIQLGRYLERTISIATLLGEYLEVYPVAREPISTDDYFEWLGLLKCFTAFEAYCKVYNADLRPYRIVEFLMFNAEFPHSVRFSVEQAVLALQDIAESTTMSKNTRVHRLVGRLRSSLSFDTVEDMEGSGARAYLESLVEQCLAIHESLYEAYITYPIEAALP